MAGSTGGQVGIPARPTWEAGRDLTSKPFSSFCFAPFVALEFDTQGFAYSCCANGTYPVGNVANDSLVDIWSGARLAAQRAAVRSGDLSYGCTVCRWYRDHDKPDPPILMYEGFEVSGEAPDWPSSLAFAFSNQCNLQCIQCSGEYSSSIRIHREGRPPLPHAYGDSFFEQLPPFLQRAQSIRLLGGEPFLVSETFRLFDLLHELRLRPSVHVTTNATRFDARVEQAFDELPMSISVSLDAVTPATLERIRVGVSAEAVLANAERMGALVHASGGSFGINFCLMRHNWDELPGILRFGDRIGARVSVITVHNDEHSLHKLSISELEAVLGDLEARDDELQEELDLNRPAWVAEIAQLRTAIDDARAGRLGFLIEPGSGDNVAVVVGRRREAQPVPVQEPTVRWWHRRRPEIVDAAAGHQTRESTVAELVAWAVDGSVVAIETDGDDIVHRVDVLHGSLTGPDAGSWPGRRFDVVADDLRAAWGRSVWLVEHQQVAANRVDQIVAFSPTPHREKRGAMTRVVSLAVGGGALVTYLAIDPSFLPDGDELADVAAS